VVSPRRSPAGRADLVGPVSPTVPQDYFYLHTRQAWRVVQQIAHENRSVGIVDTATGQEVLAHDLELMAQRYVTVHLAESAFKGISGLLEDWILGLARLWLAAYPKQLVAAYNEVVAVLRRAEGCDANQASDSSSTPP